MCDVVLRCLLKIGKSSWKFPRGEEHSHSLSEYSYVFAFQIHCFIIDNWVGVRRFHENVFLIFGTANAIIRTQGGPESFYYKDDIFAALLGRMMKNRKV